MAQSKHRSTRLERPSLLTAKQSTSRTTCTLVCYFRQGGYVFASVVCLYVCWQDYVITKKGIFPRTCCSRIACNYNKFGEHFVAIRFNCEFHKCFHIWFSGGICPSSAGMTLGLHKNKVLLGRTPNCVVLPKL